MCIISVTAILILYFWKGHFDKKVYDRICSNIKIDDKTASIPFTVNDLGDEFNVEIENEYNGRPYGEIMHDGKIVLHFGADIIGNDVRGVLFLLLV